MAVPDAVSDHIKKVAVDGIYTTEVMHLLNRTVIELTTHMVNTAPNCGSTRGYHAMVSTAQEGPWMTETTHDYDGNCSVGGSMEEMAYNTARYPFLHFLHNFRLYFTPTVVILGFIGNLMSFLVFTCTHLQRLSSSVYLAALAISDEAFLILLLMTQWLLDLKINLFYSQGWCQASIYLTYIFSFLSVWYVVAFTTERYIAVRFPLKRPEMCTVARAKIVVLSLAGFAAVFYLLTLWTNGVEDGVCKPLDGYSELNKGFIYTDTVLTFVIPSVVLIYMNIRIAIKVAYFYSKRKESDARIIVEQFTFNNRYVKHPHPVIGSPTRRSQESQMKITKMLLVVSTVFLFLNLPSHGIRIYVLIMLYANGGQHSGTQMEYVLQYVFQFLYYINFAVNFFLYCITGRNFRRAFGRLAGKFRYKTVRFFSHVSTSLRRRSTRTRSTPLPDPGDLHV
ncbi:thyrotropin-releasing hormone receptor [Lingula anatina]|uniref:Thyrotropin-releasing hormone receptor n=1 Tax=Lingula anatina TaxID=7574 RepID=A0A1S3JEI1_LINAN|nr:thyrotropin-releasing hormone receptor [Lingula anatina]XP_013408816.1 thyrotropin-releasing hormone receptor [Lingula anatina]XP_013408817.1 thyrotropin-releasing hormone receptor [Lingula anatina]|eukprot:XP_013408815.1 thyrotropin-releasing hormone receptor [Lingula anatina]